MLHIIEEQLAPVPLKFRTYSPQQALSLTPSLFSLPLPLSPFSLPPSHSLPLSLPFSLFPLPLSHSLLLFHQVLDARDVDTAKEMFEAICDHLRYATNQGSIRYYTFRLTYNIYTCAFLSSLHC